MRRLRLQPLKRLDTKVFWEISPFPWVVFPDLLSSRDHSELEREFPQLELFERQVGLPRRYGQSSHDRYYLELGESVYHPRRRGAPGVIQPNQLSPTWQTWIEELKHGAYRREIQRLLGVDSMNLRFSWHIAIDGDGVSPHRDVREKYGSHLFYFNSESSWDPDWYGETVLLGGRQTVARNVAFEEFDTRTEVSCRGNRSLFFANTPTAWHGVRPLSVPKRAQRRLFNVVFDRPGTRFPRFMDWAEAFVWQRAGPVAKKLGF